MHLADWLTEKSNHLIDWRRPGSLFFGNHRYSTKEMVERIFVITSAASLGFLRWMQSEENGAVAFAEGAALGFLISHTITMAPLIQKRVAAQFSCYKLTLKIKEIVSEEDSEFILLVNSVIKKVSQHAETKSASATWGKRERLLSTLMDWLNDVNLDSAQLIELLNVDDVVSVLNNMSHGYSAKHNLGK